MDRADDRNKDEDLPLPGAEGSGDSDKDAEQGAEGAGNVSVGYGAEDTPGQEGIQDSLANEEEEISASPDKRPSPEQPTEE